MAEKQIGNGFGITGFILGLLSIISTSSFVFALILAILGFIFSLIQIKRNKTKLAIAGLILSIIGLILTIIVFIFLFNFIFGVRNEFVNLPGFNNSLYIEGYVYNPQNNPIEAFLDISCEYSPSGSGGTKMWSDANGYFKSTILKKEGICLITASKGDKNVSQQINLSEYSAPLSLKLPG